MQEQSGKPGRPTKYRPEYDAQVEKLCRLGMTDKELADYFEVTESTLNLWKLEYPSFSESIKAGKDDSDVEVASKLYHRARGYEHDDVHISNFQGEITVTPIKKHYPPDTTAAIFWLKNRRRHSGVKWADKIEQELTGPNGESLVADPMEIARSIAFILNQASKEK